MFHLKNLRKFTRLSVFAGASLLLFFIVAFSYNNFFAGADTEISVYCRNNTVINPNCDEDHFVVFNIQKYLTDPEAIKKVAALDGYLLDNGRDAKMPVGLEPDEIDDIYDQNGKQVGDGYKAWSAVKRLYQTVASAAARDKNSVNQGLANRSIQEIDRRISTSLASYQQSGDKFVVYNVSKHIRKKADREALAAFLKANDIGFISYDTNADIANLYPTISDSIIGDIKLDSLNLAVWKNIATLYKAVNASAKTRPAEAENDIGQSRMSYDAINAKTAGYKPSTSGYERVTENGQEYFLIGNYSKWLSKDDLKQIQENDALFAGKTIRNAFTGQFIKLPVSINPESDISSGHTPLTNSIAGKVVSIYQVVFNAGEATDKDVDDSKASIESLGRFISDYYAQRGCDNANYSFGLSGSNVMICDFSKKLSKSSYMAINQLVVHIKQVAGKELPIVAVNDNSIKSDSVTIPRVYGAGNVVIYDNNDKKGWQAVVELYRYIFNNARDDQAELKSDVAASINTIEDSAKNPPVYVLLGTGKGNKCEQGDSHCQLQVFKSFASCKNLKQGDDQNITVDDMSCIISNPGDNNGEYFEPKENSKARNLLKAVLAATTNADDKVIIQAFLDDYESQFLGESSDGNVRLAAPKLLKQTSPDGLSGFQNYGANVPLKYNIDINESLTRKLAASGNDYKLGISAYVSNGSNADGRLIGVSEAKNSGEIIWNANASSDPDLKSYVEIGKHKFTTVLFAYDQTVGLPSSGDQAVEPDNVYSKLGYDFEIVGPNGERDPSQVLSDNPDSCTGGKISIVAPSIVKPANTANITANVTPPKVSRSDGATDIFEISISINKSPLGTKPEDLPKPETVTNWSLKTRGDFSNSTQTPQKVSIDDAHAWPNPTSDEGIHYIKVQTFTVIDGAKYCTGVAYKAITLDKAAPEDKCRLVGGKKVCDGDEEAGAPSRPALPAGEGSSIGTLPDLVNRIIDIFFSVIGALAVLGNVIGGIMYLTAGGDSGKAEKAKKAVLYSSIAVIIAVTAYVILHASVGTINQIITGRK